MDLIEPLKGILSQSERSKFPLPHFLHTLPHLFFCHFFNLLIFCKIATKYTKYNININFTTFIMLECAYILLWLHLTFYDAYSAYFHEGGGGYYGFVYVLWPPFCIILAKPGQRVGLMVMKKEKPHWINNINILNKVSGVCT